jgi:hypothetical protein
VKYRSVSPAVYALLAPLVLIFTAVIMPLGCSSSFNTGTGGTPQPTEGSVEVGLVDAPSSAFQSILLNVVAIRLNPAANATSSNNNWVVVPVPSNVAGAGGMSTSNLTGGGFFFNQSGIAGPGRSEIQIDLNTLQDNVQIFNIFKIPAQTYRTVQLLLDQNTPANVVPNCANGVPLHEGCVSYAAALASPYALSTSTTVPIAKHALTPLIIEVNPGVPVPPPTNGGKYGFSPVISVLPNSAGSVGAKMALVSGTVSGILGTYPRVSAVLPGTSTIVASAPVRSDGSYSFQLPVSAEGTTYNLFAFGNGSSYDVAPPLALTRGQQATVDFKITNEVVGSLGGTVTDACTKNPVSAATIALMTSPGGSTDCVTNPEACTIVTTTSTDPSGFYPQPTRSNSPNPFKNIPSAANGTYALQVTAAGYDPVLTELDVDNGKVSCPNLPGGVCNFAMTTAYIKGTVSLGNPVPPGTTTEVQVFAEDPATNTIVSALPFPVSIAPCTNAPCSAAFTLNVPTSPATFDLFATTMDLFNGVPNQYSGHTIGTLQSVPSTACPGPTQPSVAIPVLTCTGHGSVSGVVNPPYDSGTSVVMLKDGVQIQQTSVGPSGSDSAGAFSFCAPADTYQLQRFEADTPQGQPTTVTLPQPAPTSSPCPSICSFSNGTCPSNCVNTTLDAPL